MENTNEIIINDTPSKQPLKKFNIKKYLNKYFLILYNGK